MDLAFGNNGSVPRASEPGSSQEERRGSSSSNWNQSGGQVHVGQVHVGQANAGQSSPPRRHNARSRSNASISTLIESEIIPQLLVAHRLRPDRASGHGTGGIITAEDVSNFAPLPLLLQADELLVHVEGYLNRGVGVDTIFVDLLAPAARRLGDLWEEDACDFLDVTIGLWRLQEVMREIAWGSPIITGPLSAPYRALFLPMPGEQHSFGATMVHEVFVRAAWDSEVLVAPEMRQLIAKVAGKAYDLIGLTVSCDISSDALARTIKAIRSVSICQDVQILIGGHAVNLNPALAAEAGADGSAVDAPGALALANRLVGAVRPRLANAG
jgi:MerR family transcriptional regulator, light-induced transcriptional regulator